MAISRRLLIGGIGTLGAVLAACGGEAAPAAKPEPTKAPAAEPTKAPAAAAPTVAPQPTAAPTAAPKPVEITFWHTQTGGNQTALDAIVEAFNKSNPQKITVKSENQGNYTQVYQKIMAAIQAGQTPDVAVGYESMAVEYMKAKAIVALDDYALKGASALSADDLKDIFPIYIESNKYPMFQNKMLTFPFTKSLAVQYWNEDFLKSAGITKNGQKGQIMSLDEFKKATTALTKKGADGKTSVYGAHIKIDTSYIDAFIFANGGEVLDKEQAKVTFNQDAGVQIFEMWATMVKNGEAYDNNKDSAYQNDFAAGKVAGFHDTTTGRPWVRKALTADGKEPEKHKWLIGMIPQKDPNKPISVLFGGNVIVFDNKDKARPAAGWEWVKFFTNKENSAVFPIKTGYMPLRKSAAENAEVKANWEKDPQGKQAFDLSDFVRAEPQIPAWQDIRTILADALTATITGKMAAKAALDDAAMKANKLIEEKK
jgi:ABC-type glycerol-3-phosphate transport system substrate-binding protein